MIRKIFTILIFMTAGLCAQEKPFQLRAGFNQTWFLYKNNGNLPNPDVRPKFNIAFLYEVTRSDIFAVNAGIRYYNLGRAVTYDNGGRDAVYMKIDHNMLSVPLQLNIMTGIIKPDIILNAETSYILNSHMEVPQKDLLEHSRDFTNEMNRLQFSVGIGLGIKTIIENETVGMTVIYNCSLTNVPKDEIFPLTETLSKYWDKYRTSEINLTLSYFF
jgi:hypothetical protein